MSSCASESLRYNLWSSILKIKISESTTASPTASTKNIRESHRDAVRCSKHQKDSKSKDYIQHSQGPSFSFRACEVMLSCKAEVWISLTRPQLRTVLIQLVKDCWDPQGRYFGGRISMDLNGNFCILLLC